MFPWDDPPHRVNVQSVASGTDAGGGTTLAYTTVQSAAPCLINTAGSSEQERFAQQGIVVTHTVAFLSSALTQPLQRGWKLVATDTGASYHVKGIRSGRAFEDIPAFTYAETEEQL